MSKRPTSSSAPCVAPVNREWFDVDLISFCISNRLVDGIWYALHTTMERQENAKKPPLFSGPVEPGMAAQLLALADYLDQVNVTR